MWSRRHTTYITIILIITVAAALYIERSTTPTTTPAMQAAAIAYGEQHNLPRPPRPFHFDGCTLFPDTIGKADFTRACLEHDIAYWYGGNADERKAVDQTFKSAVATSGVAGNLLQWPMYGAVRLFGDTILLRPLNANWGFGHNQ